MNLLGRFWTTKLSPEICLPRCLYSNEDLIILVCLRLQYASNSCSNNQNGNGKCTDKKYVPTQLGLGCLTSSLSPDEALLVFTELQKARKSFVLENELHIIYQVVRFIRH